MLEDLFGDGAGVLGEFIGNPFEGRSFFQFLLDEISILLCKMGMADDLGLLYLDYHLIASQAIPKQDILFILRSFLS